MSLFISVYNHEEEDGRYTAESFCELPDYDEVSFSLKLVLVAMDVFIGFVCYGAGVAFMKANGKC